MEDLLKLIEEAKKRCERLLTIASFNLLFDNCYNRKDDKKIQRKYRYECLKELNFMLNNLSEYCHYQEVRHLSDDQVEAIRMKMIEELEEKLNGLQNESKVIADKRRDARVDYYLKKIIVCKDLLEKVTDSKKEEVLINSLKRYFKVVSEYDGSEGLVNKNKQSINQVEKDIKSLNEMSFLKFRQMLIAKANTTSSLAVASVRANILDELRALVGIDGNKKDNFASLTYELKEVLKKIDNLSSLNVSTILKLQDKDCTPISVLGDYEEELKQHVSTVHDVLQNISLVNKRAILFAVGHDIVDEEVIMAYRKTSLLGRKNTVEYMKIKNCIKEYYEESIKKIYESLNYEEYISFENQKDRLKHIEDVIYVKLKEIAKHYYELVGLLTIVQELLLNLRLILDNEVVAEEDFIPLINSSEEDIANSIVVVEVCNWKQKIIDVCRDKKRRTKKPI
ncbi:MAG: hypothetical protein Q4G04_06485 [bacterium]|nr:hypothetical protein [bacterium]